LAPITNVTSVRMVDSTRSFVLGGIEDSCGASGRVRSPKRQDKQLDDAIGRLNGLPHQRPRWAESLIVLREEFNWTLRPFLS
jgi:hypothetical protein